jgi:hypothetical protein
MWVTNNLLAIVITKCKVGSLHVGVTDWNGRTESQKILEVRTSYIQKPVTVV